MIHIHHQVQLVATVEVAVLCVLELALLVWISQLAHTIIVQVVVAIVVLILRRLLGVALASSRVVFVNIASTSHVGLRAMDGTRVAVVLD